jgi:hypothetical protein
MSIAIEHPFDIWWRETPGLPLIFGDNAAAKAAMRAAWENGFRYGFDQGYEEARSNAEDLVDEIWT